MMNRLQRCLWRYFDEIVGSAVWYDIGQNIPVWRDIREKLQEQPDACVEDFLPHPQISWVIWSIAAPVDTMVNIYI